VPEKQTFGISTGVAVLAILVHLLFAYHALGITIWGPSIQQLNTNLNEENQKPSLFGGKKKQQVIS
jgi:hypothetical protein